MGLSFSAALPDDAIVVYRQKITGSVRGTVLFTETGYNQVSIVIHVAGLRPGLHGFHIHECGDLRDGCKSACAHYNPYGQKHGGLNHPESHVGDLGNIIADEQGVCRMVIKTGKFQIKDIVGRCLIIHADPDDLGLKNTVESLTTGTSGERIACEIIGIAKRANN